MKFKRAENICMLEEVHRTTREDEEILNDAELRQKSQRCDSILHG